MVLRSISILRSSFSIDSNLCDRVSLIELVSLVWFLWSDHCSECGYFDRTLIQSTVSLTKQFFLVRLLRSNEFIIFVLRTWFIERLFQKFTKQIWGSTGPLNFYAAFPPTVFFAQKEDQWVTFKSAASQCLDSLYWNIYSVGNFDHLAFCKSRLLLSHK